MYKILGNDEVSGSMGDEHKRLKFEFQGIFRRIQGKKYFSLEKY